MQGMIMHHAQAVEMTDLIESRTRTEAIRLLGDRISRSQSDEMAFMTRWLTSRGEKTTMTMSAGGHSHSGHTAAQPMMMPGMLTPRQMAELRAAKGADFDRLFLKGLFDSAKGEFAMAATFSKATPIPEIVFVAFQATFAAITAALVLGAFAERARFSAVLIFTVIWFTFAYAPIAHMVWFWPGPDAYTDAKLVDALNAKAGMIWQWGALDFAGGTVVHINAGVAGLVGAYLVGKRVGFGREHMAPHSLPMTMIGASLLWVGWFGFNAGSALEANNFAGLAFMNTFLATACAVLAWTFAEWLFKGKPSMLGAASGAVAGLVAITPAAGNVGIPGAFVIGTAAGFVCLWGVNQLKRWLKADDSLDVFGVHAVGGILGALLTGVFNSPDLGGPGFTADWVTGKMITGAEYSIAGQVWTQAKAVGVTVLWTGIVAAIAFKIADLIVGLRVPPEAEREGLDVNEHGETAYHQ